MVDKEFYKNDKEYHNEYLFLTSKEKNNIRKTYGELRRKAIKMLNDDLHQQGHDGTIMGIDVSDDEIWKYLDSDEKKLFNKYSRFLDFEFYKPHKENFIKKFKDFKTINENNNYGTPIKQYFINNSLRHENMIGKKIIDNNGEEWYINSIDPIVDDTKLPYQIFCSKRPDSEFGHYINTNELFVPDHVVQIQESFDPQVLINQIGGGRAMYMMGVTKRLQLIHDKNSLIIRPKIRNKKGINYIKITLNSMDLYDIEFVRIRNVKVGLDFNKSPFTYTIVAEENNVYADMLKDVIEKNMEISLSL